MDRYWPFYIGSSEVYGRITVTVLSEEEDPKNDITCRVFQLSDLEVGSQIWKSDLSRNLAGCI